MKRIIFAALLLVCAASYAQTTSADYKAKYDRQVKMVGSAGPGVEFILDKWEEAFPDDGAMLESRFNYYFVKSKSTKIEAKPADTYLGEKPMLKLKDKEGKTVNYFEESFFDDSLFVLSSKAVDKAIKLYPDEIQYRFDKISALLAYEKESPEIAGSEVGTLIDRNYVSKQKWTFLGQPVSDADFQSAIQEYCASFFKLATPVSYEAFKTTSEKMLKFNPKAAVYMSNIGSYWFVAKKNYKEAKKWYSKALKLNPEDYSAIRNSVLLARAMKDSKAEKKYSELLASLEAKKKSE